MIQNQTKQMIEEQRKINTIARKTESTTVIRNMKTSN